MQKRYRAYIALEAIVQTGLDGVVLEVVALRNAVDLRLHVAETLEVIFSLHRKRAGQGLFDASTNQRAAFPAWT